MQRFALFSSLVWLSTVSFSFVELLVALDNDSFGVC